jgi:hypothetical protein
MKMSCFARLDRERDIGQGPGRQDRDLVRIAMHLGDQERRRRAGRRLGLGRT